MKDKNDLVKNITERTKVITEYIRDRGNKWKKGLIIIPVVFVLGVTSYYIYQSGFSHEVKLNGEVVGYVKEEETVEDVLEIVKKSVNEEYGEDAYFEYEIETERVRGHNKDVIESEELDQNITNTVDVVKPASIILVDKKEKIIVESEEDAKYILEEIKDTYIEDKEDDNIKVSKVYFDQDVEVKTEDVSVNEILTKKEVLSALGIKDEEIRGDRLARGNTALAISRSFDSRSRRQEESKSKEEILESLVDVVIVEEHKSTKTLDFKEEEKKDSSIYKGEKKVKEKGKKGKKEIITEVIYVNGKEKEKEVIKETVTEEPKNKIILVGTKERPITTARTSSNSTRSNTPTNRKSAPTYNGSIGQSIVATARNYLGYPYRAGGASPSGFDCSGFTTHVYKQYGINLPRTAFEQRSAGRHVPKSQLKPGDLVTFSGNTSTGHVGIYIGGGNMIHAATPKKGVVVASINNPYFEPRYKGGVRPY